MKKVIVLICFLRCIFPGWSQVGQFIVITPPDTTSTPPDTISNTGASTNCNVFNAEWLCSVRDGNDKVFDNSASNCCIDNKSKLYYKILYDTLVEYEDSAFSRLYYNIQSSYPGGVWLPSSYKLYGPFEQNNDYESLIQNGLAPIVTGDSMTSSLEQRIIASFLADKLYILEISTDVCSGYINFSNIYYGVQHIQCGFTKISCENCIPKFQPVDNRYVVSAWVKELEASTAGALNYENASLKVTSGGNVEIFHPAGQIIDGWQRIEGIIQTNSLGNLKMELIVDDGTAYFDDIRVSPFDGSMITYVYDPITLRLMAEMDERNYAKIYEYDEEGKLVRVKKETEKGIMTIQENRENSSTND